MGVETTISIIEDYLNCETKYFSFLPPERIHMIKEATELMKKNIDTLSKDEEVEEINIELVKKCMQILLHSVLNNPISEHTRTFVKEYSILSYNWNNNLSKDEMIYSLSEALGRMIDNHFTILEATESLKQIVSYFSDLKQWLPPAFDISKHYFNASQEEKLKEINDETTYRNIMKG